MRRLIFTSLAGLLAAGFAFPATAVFAADLRVPQSYADIASALAAARPGDRVLVSPGTYRERGLILPPGVFLAGSGATPEATIIDGQGAGRILSYENATQAAEIRNLTFTGGRVTGTSLYEGSGGAILCNNATMSIVDCTFRNNTASRNGGAIWIFESSPSLTGCVFIDNVATGGGGGVDCTLRSAPNIRNCRFENNRADWGAGLSCREYSSPTINATVFVGNTTQGSRGYGGGFFTDLDSQPFLTGCTFKSNEARYGGAGANFADSGATLIRCTLVDNRGTWRGGGLYSNNSTPVISTSIIAFQQGPGIYSGGTYGPEVHGSNLFSNAGGEWIGPAAPPAMESTNITSDPLFCENAPAGAITFHLQEASPCNPIRNGGVTIGAWPVGCTNPLPSGLALNGGWQGNTVVLDWVLSPEMGVEPQFRLTAARVATAELETQVPFTFDGAGRYSAADATAMLQGEGPFIFRLYASLAGSAWTLMAQTTVEAGSAVPGLSRVLASPNPFNPATSITFTLGKAQRVRVSVYNLDGGLVTRLADREFTSGPNAVIWNGRDDADRDLPSGTYLVFVDGAGQQVASKVTLLK